ncbi:MAG: hypothetical protein M3Z75_06580 [Actinomycetota bacterium]|nr:hypothetical protein [Actinomycetota bacterium]
MTPEDARHTAERVEAARQTYAEHAAEAGRIGSREGMIECGTPEGRTAYVADRMAAVTYDMYLDAQLEAYGPEHGPWIEAEQELDAEPEAEI